MIHVDGGFVRTAVKDFAINFVVQTAAQEIFNKDERNFKSILVSAISVALSSGISDGLKSYGEGKNFWWGNDVFAGKSQFALINYKSCKTAYKNIECNVESGYVPCTEASYLQGKGFDYITPESLVSEYESIYKSAFDSRGMRISMIEDYLNKMNNEQWQGESIKVSYLQRTAESGRDIKIVDKDYELNGVKGSHYMGVKKLKIFSNGDMKLKLFDINNDRKIYYIKSGEKYPKYLFYSTY